MAIVLLEEVMVLGSMVVFITALSFGPFLLMVRYSLSHWTKINDEKHDTAMTPPCSMKKW